MKAYSPRRDYYIAANPKVRRPAWGIVATPDLRCIESAALSSELIPFDAPAVGAGILA